MRLLAVLLGLMALALVAGCATEPDTITVPGEDDPQETPDEGPDGQPDDSVESPSLPPANGSDDGTGPRDGREAFCGTSTYGACQTDADCVRAGCSGQVCANSEEAQDIMTTCEYRQCYDARSYALGCGCVQGQCQWA